MRYGAKIIGYSLSSADHAQLLLAISTLDILTSTKNESYNRHDTSIRRS
jgi:hypothetical protein